MKQKFFGKVVRVNLLGMANISICKDSYRIETMDAHGVVHINSSETAGTVACVHVLDLTTKNINARGFRRGFVNYPYGYLSAGQYSVVARLDMEDFGLHSTKLVDLNPSGILSIMS